MPTPEQAQTELRRRAAAVELDRRSQFTGGGGGEFGGRGATGTWEPEKPIGFVESFGKRPLEKIPFSPVAAGRTLGLATAAKRLQTDDYPTFISEVGKFAESMEPIGEYTPTFSPAPKRKPIDIQMQAQQARQDDVALLTKHFEEQEEISRRGYTLGGRVGQITSEMPAFMIEYLTTGGLQKLGSTTAKRGATKILGEYAATKAGKAAIATGGFAVGTAARAAGMPHRAADAILKRQVPQDINISDSGEVKITGPIEKPMTSLWKGLTDHYIEIASEQAGEVIGPVASKVFNRLPLVGKLTGALQKKWISLKPGRNAREFAKKIGTSVGYHGVLGEVGEEFLGDTARAITDVDDFGAGEDASILERISAGVQQDIENLPAMLIAFSIPGGARQIAGRLAGRREAPAEAPTDIPPGSNVYRTAEDRIVVETPADIGTEQETELHDGRVYERATGEELFQVEEGTVSGIQEAPLSEPAAEDVVQALTPEGEDKPRVRLRAEPRSKKELLWRGHALPEAFGLDEESRRDLMEEIVGKRSMKDMSPEEQEQFVAYAEGLAEQSGVEIDAPVIERAVERLQTISKKKEKLTPTEELHQGKISEMVTGIKSWASEAYHSLQRPERFIEALDGEENGVLNENVWKPTKTADETATLNTTAGVEEYTRLLEENMIDPTLLIGKVEKVGPDIKLTKDEQVGVYLLSQNENGKRYLNDGMKISDVAILDITNNLSQTERMLGDWMAEQYESQWPTIIAAAEQAGIDTEKLAKELNYAPIIRSDIDPLEQVDFTDMLAQDFTKESFKPEQGFLEQRKKRAVGKIELSATLMYLNNVRRIERFKAMAPVVKKVGAILRNQEFKDSLNDATYGHGSKLLNTWLRDSIKGYSPTEQDLFAKMTKTLRRNAIVYAIGYNVPSSFRQSLSLSNAMAVNPLMVKHVPINLAKATKNFSKIRDEVHSKSALVRTRDYERDLRQKWDKSTLYKKLKGKDPFSKRATAWIKWVDSHTVVVAWKSLYDTAIEQGKDETAAIEYADKWVGRTQPMANAKDLPQFFRGGTLAKLISTFQNQINNNWNFYTHDIIGARAKGKISNTEVAHRVMFSYILPAIAFGMIGRGGLPKSWKQLTVDLVTYPIASIMLLGRIINRAITGWNNSTTIVEAGPEKVVGAVKSALRGDVKKTIKNAAEAVGALGGVPPTAQMSRTFTGVVDLATGETQDPRRLIWSKWALEQGKKPTTVRRRTPPPPRRRPK